MSIPNINKIVILGGGSSGWMSAAVLAKVLGCQKYEITLVESEDIGTVGVGEATIPIMQNFVKFLGISELEFIRVTNGTYKLGIDFRDWKREGESYFHPFGSVGKALGGIEFIHFWLKHYGREKASSDLLSIYNAESEAAKRGAFAAFNSRTRGINQPLNYAYHFDASLFSKYLRKYSEKLGVKRLEGRVSVAKRNQDSGEVESLVLSDGRMVDGHFFIDCSGFASLLCGKEMGVPFEDWSSFLPCDSAVAVPTEKCSNIVPPFTVSKAMPAGWQWKIPLQNRSGNGYVYASSELSDDEALKSLYMECGDRPIADPKVIRFKAGYRKTPWTKNVVAIGLSGGFLEPLESTSLYLVHKALSKLVAYFPKDHVNPSVVDMYNHEMADDYLNIRDFLVAHYHLTEREDSDFWRYCKSMNVPDTLKNRLSIFKETANTCVQPTELFKEHSWVSVLVGQGFVPEGFHPVAGIVDPEELQSSLSTIRDDVVTRCKHLPSHSEFLAKVVTLNKREVLSFA